MSYNKKFEFIAESLTRDLDKQTTEFRKESKKLIKDVIEQGDYKKYTEVMAKAVMESIDAMAKWEETSFNELEGLTPRQFFSEINSADDAVEIVCLVDEKNKGMFPSSLTERIKTIGESIEDEIAAKIDSIRPDANGKLTCEQKATIKCAQMISSEKMLDSVSKLLFRFDTRNAGDEELEYIMDVFKEVGKPSISCLIAACEKSGHEGNIYTHCIMALGEIASKCKSEEVYMYLKECFRKSDNKLLEASALGLYGDGRAVTAIRSYVEGNIFSIDETTYSAYRDIILRLGGMVDDIDNEYLSVHGDY